MPAEVFFSYNQNDPRTEGEMKFLELVSRSQRFDGWKVFEQPHINNKKPDFVLTHPQRGVVIVEVKDWDLSIPNYQNAGFRGTDGLYHEADPIKQVESYKESILMLDLLATKALADAFGNYFGVIETAVYFSRSDRKQAERFCGQHNNTKIWVSEDIEKIGDHGMKLDSRKYTHAIACRQSNFSRDGLLQQLVEELDLHLSYSDYNYERIEPHQLTTEQRRVAKIKNGSIRRCGGVAGSGKSLILAQKAVYALKETRPVTHKSVLLLSYNITLRHYLRDLCSQQFGPETYPGERKLLKASLSIEHFHGLLNDIMQSFGLGNDTEAGQDFTEGWIQKINTIPDDLLRREFGYNHILIDEGQDFKPSWIRLLQRLYTGNGEFFIVYDKNQDIYGNYNNGVWIEDSEQVRGLGFKGTPGYLQISERMPNPMIKKIEQMRQEIFLGYQEIRPSTRNILQNELLNTLEWQNLEARTAHQKVQQVAAVVAMLRAHNHWEDITILTTNEYTGVPLVEYFRNLGVTVSHVYDMTLMHNNSNRRKQKKLFHGGTGNLKISSYHSYKGWQTPNVILVLDSNTTRFANDDPERVLVVEQTTQLDALIDALFISMTRVKGRADTGAFTFYCLNYVPEFDDYKRFFV